MRTIILAVILILATKLFSQDLQQGIENYETSMHRCELLIKQYEDSIKYYNNQIKELKILQLTDKYRSINGIISISSTNGFIRVNNSAVADVIGSFNSEDTIILKEYFSGYWLVEYKSLIGYVSEAFIKETPEVCMLKSINIKKYEQKKVEVDQEYKSNLSKTYGEDIAVKILNKEYWLGMTSEMAQLSLGSPNSINKSVGAWGVHEQWVYENLYLYFENGKMTSYQNSH